MYFISCKVFGGEDKLVSEIFGTPAVGANTESEPKSRKEMIAEWLSNGNWEGHETDSDAIINELFREYEIVDIQEKITSGIEDHYEINISHKND